jgi:hypothetical protein
VDRQTGSGQLIEVSERWRLYSDIAVVIVYAYVLFQIRPLVNHPDADIRYLLLGYPFVFVLYLGSGYLRIARYGQEASKIPPILLFLAIFVLVLVLYIVLRDRLSEDWLNWLSKYWLNWAFLILTLGAMGGYRWFRRWWVRKA